MTVLITGGNGFVGVNLAECLVASGVDVVALSRGPLPPGAERAIRTGSADLTVAFGDVRDTELVESVMETNDVSAVVHAAIVTAGVDRERSDARSIIDINVMGTTSVLEAARRVGVHRFLYASSGAVYGDSRFAEEPVDETSCPAPNTMYGITKHTGELLAQRFGELWSMQIVRARIAAVFGPWERDTGSRDTLSPVLAAAGIALRRGHARVSVGTAQDWIYSRDVAVACAALLQAPALAHEVYNLGPGEAWGIEPWLELLSRRFPGFTYELDAPEPDVVQFTDPERMRTPIRAERIHEIVPGFPTFDRDTALEDFADWLEGRSSDEPGD